MKKLIQHTVKDYVQALSKKQSAPGGGSAAALTGAVGVSLIAMAGRYSLSKAKTKAVATRIRSIIKQADSSQKRLLQLVDEDAKAYAALVAAKGDKKAYAKANREASAIPKEVVKLSQKAINWITYLVKHGNRYLVSDVEAAAVHLLAACQSAKAMIEANQ